MNLKKGIALALTAAALLAFTGCGSNGTTSNGEYKVGVVQLVEHPALDAANKGFVDALKEKEVESLGRMVLDIENMKREFRKFYQLAESLTGMQNDLNQFRKVASDVRQMKTAMSQLQVSAKLNGNAVARILQQMQEQEPEPDSTEDSAES